MVHRLILGMTENPVQPNRSQSKSDEPLLTTRELARDLKVTDRTIQNLVYRGEIRKIQIGRCVRFLKSDVIADLKNQT